MSRNELNSDKFISKSFGIISYKIGKDWIRWGRHLGLNDSDLDNIDSDNNKVYDKAYNVLKLYKQINGHLSFEKLQKELIAFRRFDIVIEIEKKFRETNSPEIPSRFPANKDLSKLSAELKKFYLEYYGKISETQPLLKTPANVDLLDKFVDLCMVDAVNTQMDAVFSVERNKFLEKQVNYTPIPYSEIFTKEESVILISGIAGIGKTWLLRKCLLDWSNDLIWKDVELVFYLECRMLNRYQNISNINEILSLFYKDVINDFNICSVCTALFIIDGLDEFKYFNELLNPSLSFNHPIVNALAEIQNYNHVVAGRVYAIDQYQSVYTERSDKLTIQIMGFNENGITNYVENHVMEENKEVIKATLKESPIAKAMASVPFYLSCMIKIISDSKKSNKSLFLTMTDLYANIFLYFLRKHIIKNNKFIYEIMEDSSNKKFVLNICKIAYELFVENKVIFSREEILTFVGSFDKNESSFFGFIERIETDLGCYYQFAHYTIMEFCASVYAYNCLSSDEIMANERLKNCLSMVCGLANKKQNSLLKFLVNLNPLKKSNEESTLVCSILNRLSESIVFYKREEYNLFYECFYESQLFTDEIKLIDEKLLWCIWIDDRKTSCETARDSYFINYFINSGGKLMALIVNKCILSEAEKNLLTQCSTNVRYVYFYRPIKFEALKPIHKIECLTIWISSYFITKKDFEEIFLPWINTCEELNLNLHKGVDFIKDVYEWICCSNIKWLVINFRGKEFKNLYEFKNFITCENI